MLEKTAKSYGKSEKRGKEGKGERGNKKANKQKRIFTNEVNFFGTVFPSEVFPSFPSSTFLDEFVNLRRC